MPVQEGGHIGVTPLLDFIILAAFGRSVVASILGVVEAGAGIGASRTASFAGVGAGASVSTGVGSGTGAAATTGGLATATSVGGTGPEGGAEERSWVQATWMAATTTRERLRFMAGTSPGHAGL